MKQRRCTEEQIIIILTSVEDSQKISDVCRTNAISEATYYRWKSTYGGMEVALQRPIAELIDATLLAAGRSVYTQRSYHYDGDFQARGSHWRHFVAGGRAMIWMIVWPKSTKCVVRWLRTDGAIRYQSRCSGHVDPDGQAFCPQG